MMQIRLLGPVDVTVAGSALTVSGLRRKAVLATLALHPGRVVSTDHLIDVVWGDQAPATAVNSLQSHVSYLRRVLGTRSVIVARSPGYVLDLPGEATDVEVAERLMREARESPDRTRSAACLRTAVALWRDRPLADVDTTPWLHDQADRLAQLGREATRELIEARLALGEHAQLVSELERLAHQQPLDEQVHAQLMLAHYRAGRQGDALATFRRLRHTLGEDLGIDPSPALRNLQAAILRQDPAISLPEPPLLVHPPDPPTSSLLRAPAPGLLPTTMPTTMPTAMPAATPVAMPAIMPAAMRAAVPDIVPDTMPATMPTTMPTTVPTTVPAQLPPVLSAFAGREEELGRLDGLLPQVGEEPAAPAPGVISVLSGTAGVGKTTLALHWAHRVAAGFPDGQLYVNLRGFDPARPVTTPTEALRGFLSALGVPAERIPGDPEAQTGLYRSVLAGKRVLVLLDNAHDAEQVRPLLPASPGCLVLVTSRNQFAPLIVAEGARPLVVELLAPAEALALLTCRLGRSRLAAEPQAVEEIIARCAGLPLALSIVAARAATHPAFSLAALAAQLRGTSDVLDAFHGGDAATDVRAVFSWSYRTLSPATARVFRLLGLHPGAELSAAAAASLAGLAPQQVRPLLIELTRAHLLTETTPGRYSFHDLLHAYASEQAAVCEGHGQREAARQRLLDHYLRTAHAADLLLHPHRSHRIALPPVKAGVTAEEPADLDQALSWFAVARPALTATVEVAAGNGWDAAAVQLAWTLTTFLERQGHWDDLVQTQRTALAAARRLGDRSAQALAHCGLAGAEVRLRRFDEAHYQLRRARDLFESLGDRGGQAQLQLDFGWMLERQNRYAEALSHAEQALDLFRSAGHQDGQARALNQIGWCHARLDDHYLTLDCCQQALALHQKLGDRAGAAHTWDSLGHAHHHLGFHRQAVTCYRQAVDLFHRLGDRYNEAETLSHLADVHEDAGDAIAARSTRQQALTILDELHQPGADHLRANLEPAEPVGGHAT